MLNLTCEPNSLKVAVYEKGASIFTRCFTNILIITCSMLSYDMDKYINLRKNKSHALISLIKDCYESVVTAKRKHNVVHHRIAR